MNNPISILLVDDSLHFLNAARDFLDAHKFLKIVGEVRDEKMVLTQAEASRPDVILLDINLGTQSGLNLIPQIKRLLPQTKIIVLSIMEAASYSTASTQAGADAFVHKSALGTNLIPSINFLMKRHLPVSDAADLEAASLPQPRELMT